MGVLNLKSWTRANALGIEELEKARPLKKEYLRWRSYQLFLTVNKRRWISLSLQ
jgi:hypothetical protein